MPWSREHAVASPAVTNALPDDDPAELSFQTHGAPSVYVTANPLAERPVVHLVVVPSWNKQPPPNTGYYESLVAGNQQAHVATARQGGS